MAAMRAVESVPGVKGLKVLGPMEALLRPETQTQARTPSGAYALVPWIYRCTALRANAVASMPFSVQKRGSSRLITAYGKRRRAGGEPIDPAEYPFIDQLRPLLWRTEASLCLYGAAYWFRQRNRVKTLGLRWFSPETITPRYDAERGLVAFERVLARRHLASSDPGRYVGPEHDPLTGDRHLLGGGVQVLDPDDVVHFWMPDPEVEIGPGRPPAEVALECAGLARNTSLYAAEFFLRGAVPTVMLAVDGNPSEPELRRMEAWWKQLLRGVKNAWTPVAVRAGVKPVVIGQPVRDLAMPELKQGARQEIAVAFGVPQTLLEDASNYATAREHRKSFYSETVIPECDLIAHTLNEQLLHPMGMEIVFTPEQHEVMQEDEVERAGSLVTLRNAGIPLLEAMEILGYDLSDEQRARLEGFVESRELEYARARLRRDQQAAENPEGLLRHAVPPLAQSLGDNGLGRGLEP